MAEVQKLHDKIRAFLLYGGSFETLQAFSQSISSISSSSSSHLPRQTQDDAADADADVERSALLPEIKRVAHHLTSEWDAKVKARDAVLLAISDIQAAVVKKQEALDGSQLSGERFETKLRRHKVLELKIMNLSLGLALHRLVHFRNVLHVPNLVQSVVAGAQNCILKQSQLEKVIIENTTALKLRLLSKFHALFEEHLTHSSGNSNSNSNSNSSNSEFNGGSGGDNISKKLWVSFLGSGWYCFVLF